MRASVPRLWASFLEHLSVSDIATGYGPGLSPLHLVMKLEMGIDAKGFSEL